MKQIYSINNINTLDLHIAKPFVIFMKWDLWAGKTTLTKHIINNILWINTDVISPTYTYYNKYYDVYHFDLYRLKAYDEFFAIWWEDILDNNSWVIIIEWPEIIEQYYKADLEIVFNKTENPDEREIELIYK